MDDSAVRREPCVAGLRLKPDLAVPYNAMQSSALGFSTDWVEALLKG